MSRIACESLVRSFEAQRALDGASMEAPAGRFTAILGPSGSGKTTLLRIVAGLEQADGGRVVIGEQTVSDPAPTVAARDRGIGMVFQSLGLWPHMTAAKHLRFVLKARGGDPASRDARIAELLTLVGLPDRGDAKPAQLSGGEQQRVALARALAGDPQVLLLDEPFGALDAALRRRLREAVRAVQRSLGLTTVLVTHDQEEALAVADHLVVMNEGRVEQAGPPAELYAAPATAFVAEFLGGAVLVPATVAGGSATTDLGEFATEAVDGHYRAVVRHDALTPATAPDGVAATVAASTFTGGHWLVEAVAAGHTVRFRHAEPLEDGAPVRLQLQGPLHLVADGA